MFSQLFAESGLSLDRLRVFLEIGSGGSIVKAAGGDPVRQSQFSRQVKELEEFFRIKLIERQGRGMQLTSHGKELARIARFFLLGLSNFQRGCLAEDQSFRIGASSAILQKFVVPALIEAIDPHTRYTIENLSGDEIERRLHDLTLDFGIVTKSEISRPLQIKEIGKASINIFVPKQLHNSRKSALRAVKDRSLPLALPLPDLDQATCTVLNDFEAVLICDSILTARAALERENMAGVLPGFASPDNLAKPFWRLSVPNLSSHSMRFRLAWNPRLLRLNPHVIKCRDFLVRALTKQFNRNPLG